MKIFYFLIEKLNPLIVIGKTDMFGLKSVLLFYVVFSVFLSLCDVIFGGCFKYIFTGIYLFLRRFICIFFLMVAFTAF